MAKAPGNRALARTQLLEQRKGDAMAAAAAQRFTVGDKVYHRLYGDGKVFRVKDEHYFVKFNISIQIPFTDNRLIGRNFKP